MLTSIAGIVDVVGFFAVHQLTTNVTGHFAFFMEEVFKSNFWQGFMYFLYVFCFFFGAFCSNFLIELISKRDQYYIYIIPAILECAILFFLGIWGSQLAIEQPNLIACSLLFTMGLQNSLATTISNTRVRTTHLTGLFTDLGIELSQLFFYKTLEQNQQLKSSISLKLITIVSFFIGGIVGGFLYVEYGMKTLLFAMVLLLLGILYDTIKLRLILLQRKARNFKIK